jgi:hypothetical protein
LRPRRLPVAAGASVFVVAAALIFAAAWHDDVLWLPGTGRGLLDHYGYLTCFLTGPLVLLNTYVAVGFFLRLLREIDQLLVPDADTAVVSAITKPHIDSIRLQGPWKFMLLLMCFVGVAASLVIFAPLDRPETYWGNDVFNAERYPLSWLAGCQRLPSDSVGRHLALGPILRFSHRNFGPADRRQPEAS